MGWSAWALATMLTARIAFTAPAEESTIYLVDFTPDSDAELVSRELCLQYQCEVRHVYRNLPGMAASGKRLHSLSASPRVSAVYSDQEISLDSSGSRLVGAPLWAPLVVVGPRLDPDRLIIERSETFYGEGEGASPDGTELVYGLASRSPDRRFWVFPTLNKQGKGRLSDLLAALDALIAFRYAVSAVYAPLELTGPPSPRLCASVDHLHRRGLLLLSSIDRSCPLAPGEPFQISNH